ILRTRFPAAPNGHETAEKGLLRALGDNLRSVLGNRRAAAWLLFLFVLALIETPALFIPVWLADEVGLSQAMVGVYQVVDIVASILGLVALERWLARADSGRILILASLALLILYPVWLFAPGVWPRFVLAAPINFAFVFFWPIGKAQLLASAPGRAGAVTAVSAVFALVPLPLLFGLLAERAGLTPAMLAVTLASLLIMLGLTTRPGFRSLRQTG
ncbi:MAG: hypothetical protein ACRDHL_00510, partial [Candidatus Promineifilaceae bacterium]